MNKDYERNIFFNLDPNVQSSSASRDFISNDPIVQLRVGRPISRNKRQNEELNLTRNNFRSAKDRARSIKINPSFEGSPVLPDLLDWAYCTCIVQHLTPGNANILAGEPLGGRPAQPVDRAAGTSLLLFNVLVALEWEPDEDYIRQLEWAFRRASDFLYDVTDGRMAFGQVVFAGVEWMNCCDIQILASNRFHPRSWVSGLHEADKYLPIRLGRGFWHQRNHACIPWDEPEAYRVLVHEWAHYALDLRDAYLEPVEVLTAKDTNDTDLNKIRSQILVRKEQDEHPAYTVVVRRMREANESIMETTVGTSELVPHTDGSTVRHKQQEWTKIQARFGIQPPSRLLAGPGRLPLPLPQFGRLIEMTPSPLRFPSKEEAPALFKKLPKSSELDHCWLYIIRDLDSDKPRLIPQGTLDTRSEDNGFELLDAIPNDAVVLIVGHPLEKPTVLCSFITKQGELESEWSDVTPKTIPVIDVLPHEMSTDHRLPSIKVRVKTEAGQQPDRVWIFPLGQADEVIPPLKPDQKAIWVSERREVPTLDGYILARWREEDKLRVMIKAFSQGGGPPSNGAFAPIPITAGSSDGNVMLFFHEMGEANGELSDKAEEYSQIKVITTIDNGAHSTLPYAKGLPDPKARPYSYPFSIASNESLAKVAKFHPTLVVHYDMPNERELLTGDLLICRLVDGKWEEQPTYIPAGASFAATPLTEPLSLFNDDQLRIEHYQLFWIPRGRSEVPEHDAKLGDGVQEKTQ